MKKISSAVKAMGYGSQLAGTIRTIDKNLPLHLQMGWVRGRSRIDNEVIIMENDGRETYFPEHEITSVLLEFLDLNIDEPAQVIKFVEQFGLLSTNGYKTSSESVTKWSLSQAVIRNIIDLHITIQAAKRGDLNYLRELASITDSKYRHAMRPNLNGETIIDGDNIAQIFVNAYEQEMFGQANNHIFLSSQQAQLIRVGMNTLASNLNHIFNEITTTVEPTEVVQNDDDSNGVFEMMITFNAPSLWHFLLLQVAMMATENVSLRKCHCGKFFPVTRSDRTCCSEACSDNIRSSMRRSKIKKAENSDAL